MAKIGIIIECVRRHVSEIKLKRTDTTLDLSQKAKRAKEKKEVEEAEGSEGICTRVLALVAKRDHCMTHTS